MLGKRDFLGAFDERTGEPRVKVANIAELGQVNEIEDFIKEFKPDPHFLYLHVIAMGAGEYYGCNKNGDYFPERSLMMYYHTFEQNAKVFKEHNNKPDSPSYGYVPKAWYNPMMHRVELILAVDKEKAPDIVCRVEAGETLEVSMGCRIPHDVCSICGNKAAKKHQYCDHIKFELKMTYGDGRQVFMLNLQPTFFDISIVGRRADKIAYMLKKVAGVEEATLDHIFDIEEEKTAAEKMADLVKRVPAEAVVNKLNNGMFNVLPQLEEIEPDLPTAMLDRLALRHSIQDILASFLHNMIPMKPREFTRVIIVNGGYPMQWYNPMLQGVMSAPRHEDFELGEPQDEIASLLAPFMQARSSFGPHVQRRVLLLRGLPKTASSNFDPAMYGLTNMQPGSQSMPVEYANLLAQNTTQHYSTVPVMYSPDEYARRQQDLQQRHLRKPINPFAIGLLLGALYASSRGVKGLQKIVTDLGSDSTIAKAGVGSLALVGAMRAMRGGTDEINSYNHVKQASIKEAAKMGWGTKYFVLPFVGAHLASAHYRRKYYQGQELNGVEKFVAENPDYLSIAAPFAMHFGSKHMGGIQNAGKKVFKPFMDFDNKPGQKMASYVDPEFSMFYDNVNDFLAKSDNTKIASDDEITKIADFGDVLADSLVQGIIFHGRGTSGVGAVSDMALDNAMFRRVGEMAKPKNNTQGNVQPSKQNPLPSQPQREAQAGFYAGTMRHGNNPV